MTSILLLIFCFSEGGNRRRGSKNWGREWGKVSSRTIFKISIYSWRFESPMKEMFCTKNLDNQMAAEDILNITQ